MHPRDLQQAYRERKNISALLRAGTLDGLPSEETIEVVYDLQAGAYVRALNDPRLRDHKVRYGQKIARLFAELGPVGSLLEPGIGEGTSLSFILNSMPERPHCVHGFDLSWSRIDGARRWLAEQGQSDVFLSVARLSCMPYQENSFDVVLTSHAIEPNRGQEEVLLRELYRVASRYLIMLEPGYELAGEAERMRMDQHGYCRGLAETAQKLGMKVLRHELFGESANPMNPTALILIEKSRAAPPAMPVLACPCFGDELELQTDAYYSRESMRAYPILRGIPCLRPDKAIVAAHYLSSPEFVTTGCVSTL